MQNSKFYGFGYLIYRLRWPIIALWFILLLSTIPFLPNIIKPFTSTGFIDENSESAKMTEFLNKEFKYDSQNKFPILYTSKNLDANKPLFNKKIKMSLEDLKGFPIKHEIIYPSENKNQISKDKHTAYAVVILKTNEKINDDKLNEFKSLIKKPTNMEMHIGGEPIFVDEVNKQTQEDLYKADFIATPVSIIVLLLVFGSFTAAIIPILLGGGAALLILTTLYALGHLFSLSIFTLNIALLLGLCLTLDYSLFVISRFRNELLENESPEKAIATTQATAGKAVFFSGLAVFASLSAMLIFPVNILFSVAVGGLSAVFIAVFTAIVFLPAILSVLKSNINRFPIRIMKKRENKSTFWHWLAEKVVKRPVMYFVFILGLLILLGLPFYSADFGVSDYRIFPEKSENRRFFDIYSEKFNENELNPIQVVVQTKDSSKILSRINLSRVYDLAREIKKNPSVAKVNSIVTADANLNKNSYYNLYNMNKKYMNESIKKSLATTTGNSFTVINVVSKYDSESEQTQKLIEDIEKLKLPHNIKIDLTGTPVSNKEVLESISKKLPWALLWILVSTYLILLVLLRSLFLPFKAIIMTILSLSACYGALVLVFQDGYLHQLLNFEPQGMLDISLLVIIFCALFGFSMDYEVFLLSRIKESYEIYKDNKKSIIFGIEHSSKIITNAALIVICICFSFLVAQVLMVKAFGLGIAVAIFVDAFLIRTLLVPSTMTLTKSWNWYLPKWLDRILPHL